VEGVGTRWDKIGAIFGGAFGFGVLPRLDEAYARLCENWANAVDEEDRAIDIVGFSRGSATALDFCHRIQENGIKKPKSDEVIEANPTIRFLGLWDIVASFGLASLGDQALNFWHHLEIPQSNIDYCFHAMALDERRPSFLPIRLRGACEVWFRGVHSDIGGGNGNRPLNDVCLRWMMNKAKAAHLPIDDGDIPAPVTGPLEPNHSNRLPLKIRLIGAVDRCHYTVAPLPDWANPPATCPKETPTDEQAAPEVGDAGVVVETDDSRRRVLAMWETAMAVAAARDFTLNHVREPLLTLFEGRVALVTDEAKLHDAREAVARLIATACTGAQQRGFHELEEFFLNEALFKMPRVFPLTD
jgi:hypothetical protein